MRLKKAVVSLSLAFAVAASAITADLQPASAATTDHNGERSLSFYNTHTGQSLDVTYYRGGRYVPSAMNEINNIMRDHRRNEPTHMDRDVINLIHDIEQELNRRYPGKDITFHIISGYRSRATNEALRRNGGGQAKNSRHIHGDAVDIRVPGIPTSEIRDIAWCLQQGGVGYYRNSNFVHVDTAGVRHWNWTPNSSTCKP